jgi:hypothetical protein
VTDVEDVEEAEFDALIGSLAGPLPAAALFAFMGRSWFGLLWTVGGGRAQLEQNWSIGSRRPEWGHELARGAGCGWWTRRPGAGRTVCRHGRGSP